MPDAAGRWNQPYIAHSVWLSQDPIISRKICESHMIFNSCHMLARQICEIIVRFEQKA